MDKIDLIKTLTPREREVLYLLSKGLSNKDIAKKLYLSEGTVRVYLTNTYSKLEVSSRTQALLVVKEIESLNKFVLGNNKVKI